MVPILLIWALSVQRSTTIVAMPFPWKKQTSASLEEGTGVVEADNEMHGEYTGKHGPLLLLAVKTGLLTTVTLGIYRFWARTRIRRYIWSSTTADGDGFEYTGTGVEKFLGFLMAVVILAVYLGILQLVLLYFGLSLFAETENPDEFAALPVQYGPTVIAFLAVLPLTFFAQYRSRRYRLARTRWRGLRFGMEHGAWGYAVRALGHLFLTVVTLGVLLPRNTFWLEKYVTDRSWYGDARFEQKGRWTELFPAMKHLFIGTVILIAGTAAAAQIGVVVAIISAIIGVLWLLTGYISYRVNAFIYLMRNKTLDGQIYFMASTKTSTVVSRIVIGGLAVSILAGIIFTIVAQLTAPVLAQVTSDSNSPGTAFSVVIVVLQYVAALAVMDALVLVWITQPIINHVVQSVSVMNVGALDGIHQRAVDPGADAEGFADALDVGGAL